MARKRGAEVVEGARIVAGLACHHEEDKVRSRYVD
jgi:hypothetical protein